MRPRGASGKVGGMRRIGTSGWVNLPPLDAPFSHIYPPSAHIPKVASVFPLHKYLILKKRSQGLL